MLKTIRTSTPRVKRVSTFLAVFALTGVLMGNALIGSSESLTMSMMLSQPVHAAVNQNIDRSIFDNLAMNEVWEPESGALSDFAAVVQESNDADMQEAPSIFFEREEVEPEAVSADDEMGQAQFVYHAGIPLSEELQEYTYNRCEELGLEYELILAIMWRESRFEVNAVGYNSNGTRDNGLMQINDVNRAWLRNEYGITDLMDPYQNIDAGTAMIAELIDSYGSEEYALMAYHYGESGMKNRVRQGVTTSSSVNVALEKKEEFKTMLQSV